MRKYCRGVLYSLLLLGLLYLNGCQVAGGGGMRYNPPENIICGQPWIISADFFVVPPDPKEKFGKLTERYKNVTVHIRDSVNSDFIAIPMVIEGSNPQKGDLQMKADMKPIPCESGVKYVEYYIDSIFSHNYNRTKSFVVPINRK